MRTLILAGLALAVMLIDLPQADALGGRAAWCRIGRDVGGRDCSFYTFEQCAMATERLNGGGCYENPNAADPSPGAVRPERAKATRHKARPNDASR
jgi:hypothetical protein